MSKILSRTDSWRGFQEVKYLFVFGDSFSTVGYSSRDPPPSAEEPLGIPFPGLTSCERVDESKNAVTYEPNWVGSLAKAVNAQRTPSDALRVLDYAISGDTIARMKLWQVRREFIPQAGTTRPSWAPWTATDALFVTWIGINDCTWSIRLAPASAQASFDDLFKAQTELYDAGARNFCLIDVPPVHIFPGGPKAPHAKDAYKAWNPLLEENATKFCAAHPDASVFIFSSWEVFTRHLEEAETSEALDALFVDGFHPGTHLHGVIANELQSFLENVSSQEE